MNTPPLYFLHIDKTGGMSLSWVLRRAYPMHHSVVSAQYEDVSYIDSFHSYDYIDGHLAWLPDHLLQPGTLRCTVLRDPIARTISHMLYDQYSLSANLLANLDRLKPFITKEEEEALRKGDFLRDAYCRQRHSAHAMKTGSAKASPAFFSIHQIVTTTSQ